MVNKPIDDSSEENKNVSGYVLNNGFISRIARQYELNPIEFADLYHRQAGKCGICGVELKKTQYHIDHDHNNGRVRGLLCRLCNQGIGFFKDSSKLMFKATQYLEGESSEYIRLTRLEKELTERETENKMILDEFIKSDSYSLKMLGVFIDFSIPPYFERPFLTQQDGTPIFDFADSQFGELEQALIYLNVLIDDLKNEGGYYSDGRTD